MAHQIGKRDKQIGLNMAWHGLTEVVKEVTRELALPYEIERQPIFVNGVAWQWEETNSQGEKEQLGFSAFVCSDDKLPVGKPVASTYHALTNARFWEIVQNSLGGTSAVIESAGTIYDRARRFISVNLGADLDTFKIDGREFKNYFNFLDSIDGSTNFVGVNSSICVVCANTFRMSFEQQSELRFKIRHTKGLTQKIDNMEQIIDKTIGVRAQFQKALTEANSYPISAHDAQDIFAGYVIGKTEDRPSTRSLNVVERLNDLFLHGKGNSGQTLLDAVSAVTDYYSHESSGGRSSYKQWISSEFGTGEKSKSRFISEVLKQDGINVEGVNSLRNIGKHVLALA